MVLGSSECSGDANNMWGKTINCIREVAREVLGVLQGNFGAQQGDWWCNGEVQGQVEAKKVAMLMESKDKEEERTNMVKNKVANKDTKLAINIAKTSAFECLHAKLGDKSRDKKLYRLAKARERKSRDLIEVKCIKDEDGKVLMEEAHIRL